MTNKKKRQIVTRALKPTGLSLPVRAMIARSFVRDTQLSWRLFGEGVTADAARAAIVVQRGCDCGCGEGDESAWVQGPAGSVDEYDLSRALRLAEEARAARRAAHAS